MNENENEINEKEVPEKIINLESQISQPEFLNIDNRVTSQFNPNANKEEEKEFLNSSNTPLQWIDILKSVFVYKLPLVFLIVYIILVTNYATLIYFMIGLLLINLEFENYYIKQDHLNPLNTPLKNGSAYFLISSFKYYLYIALCTVALILFIFKIIYTFLLMFDPFFASKLGVSSEFLQNFDIYINTEFHTNDTLITFLPNFFVFIIALILLILKRREEKKLEKWILDLEQQFKILMIINYLIIFCFMIIPAFSFTFIGLVFLVLFLIMIIINALKKFYTFLNQMAYYFYHLMKLILLIVFFLNYFAYIQLNKENFHLHKEGFYNFNFLGINSFYDITSVDVFNYLSYNKVYIFFL